MEAFQQVAAAFVLLRKLALIDAIAVFEYQSQIAQEDASERKRIFMLHQFLTHLGKELCDAEPFGRFHPKGVGEEIGEILESVHVVFQIRAMKQLGRPQEHPSTQGDAFAVVFQSAYLSWGNGNDRGIAHLQGLHSVGENPGELALDEERIDTVVVQAVTEGSQLIVVDDADQLMQYWGFHKLGIVVRAI